MKPPRRPKAFLGALPYYTIPKNPDETNLEGLWYSWFPSGIYLLNNNDDVRWNMSEWTEWTYVAENPDYEGYGVFKMRLINSKGFPVEIPRFLDKDEGGILYIGHGENIRRRIRFFRGAIKGKKYTSTEGEKLNLIIKYCRYKESYTHFKIQYSFKKSANKTESKAEAERLVKSYFKRYGEVPPVNNYLPHKYIDWESLRDYYKTVWFPTFAT